MAFVPEADAGEALRALRAHPLGARRRDRPRDRRPPGPGRAAHADRRAPRPGSRVGRAAAADLLRVRCPRTRLRRAAWMAIACASAIAGCSPAPPAGPAASASPVLPSPDLTAGQRAFDLLRMAAARDAFAAAARAHPEAPLAQAYLALALNGSGAAADAMAAAVRVAASAPPARTRARRSRARVGGLRLRRRGARAGRSARDRPRRCASVARAWAGEAPAAAIRRRGEGHGPRSPGRSRPGHRAAAPRARAPRRGARGRSARGGGGGRAQRCPTSRLSHLVQCEVLRRAGDRPGAIAACGRAITLDPGNVTAWQGRAYVHRDREDFAAARDDFEAAFAVASALPDTAYKDLMVDWAKAEDISFDVAMTYLLENRWREAEKAAEETAAFTQRTRPANAVFYYDALGRIYLQNGKPREAARAYQRGHESIEAVAGSARGRADPVARPMGARDRPHPRPRRALPRGPRAGRHAGEDDPGRGAEGRALPAQPALPPRLHPARGAQVRPGARRAAQRQHERRLHPVADRARAGGKR